MKRLQQSTVALQIAVAVDGGVSSDRVEDSGIQDESWRANPLAQSRVSSAMSGDDCSAGEWTARDKRWRGQSFMVSLPEPRLGRLKVILAAGYGYGVRSTCRRKALCDYWRLELTELDWLLISAAAKQ